MDKKLKYLNLIIPIIFLIILLFTNPGDNFVSILSLTLVIGWLFPYITPILTSIALFNDSHKKLSLIINILNILMCIVLIYFLVKIYEKSFIVYIIEYSILGILSIFNSIYFYKIVTLPSKEETKKIKEIKKKNNGIIK